MSHLIEQFTLEGSYDEDLFARKYQLLLNGCPVDLFTKGGCHVFAMALHEEFGYPLRLIPKDNTSSVSHVYCHSGENHCYAVDVCGHTDEQQRLWHFGAMKVSHNADNTGLGYPEISSSHQPINITVNDLRKYFTVNEDSGLFAHKVFIQPAYDIAMGRIKKYRRFFDGSCKKRTPDCGHAAQAIGQLEKLVKPADDSNLKT